MAARRLIHAAALTIVLAAWVAYHNSLSSPFVFDDSSSIIENRSIRKLWPLGPVFTPAPECTVAGRPVANLSFALNYAWGELSVWGYHAVNLALHSIAGLLLFGIVRRTLARLRPESEEGRADDVGRGLATRSLPLAFAAAVLWIVHPVTTGTVSYVSQRTELMMAVFYLCTLYAFVRGVETESRSWWVASVVACVAGMGSKEVMVTAPVLVLLYDWAFVSGSLAATWRRHAKYYLALSMSWLLLAFLMVGLERRAVGFGLGVSWWDYAFTECRAVVIYLRLVAWPFPLVWDYGPLFLSGVTLGWVAALTALVAAAGGSWFRSRRAGFLAVMFFVVLAPTSSIVPVAAQPMAENRVYLPAAAVVVLFVVGLFAALGKKCWPVFAMMAVASTWNTVQRNKVFQDPMTLWTDAVAKAPLNRRAHENLGEICLQQGKLAEARSHIEEALRLEDTYPEAHNNLGIVLLRLGDLPGARRHFETAVRMRPEFAEAHDHLGNLLMQFGAVSEAQAHLEVALRIRPEFPAALNNLGNALLAQGKVADAQTFYREALRLQPTFAQARMNLGVTLRQLGQPAEARRCFEEAVRLDPGLPEGRLALGVVLLESGEATLARREFETALKLRPFFPEAHNNLANALLKEGRMLEARQHLEEALRLRPEYPDARATLTRVLEVESAGRQK